MKLPIYLALLVMALVVSAMLPEIDIVTSILAAESVNVGEFQIGTFIILAILSTIGFILDAGR